ncbi:Uncharacterised protein [Bordetella pertussis]|nr:Uncharacterised protein [Bordetella pertussis]
MAWAFPPSAPWPWWCPMTRSCARPSRPPPW